MTKRTIYFISSSPKLTADYPFITNAKFPHMDMVQFKRAIFGNLSANEVFLLPSGALTPSILAGSLLRAISTPTENTVETIDVDQARRDLLPDSVGPGPYSTKSKNALAEHRHVLDKLARDILYGIANERDTHHVIAESVPGGTFTATVRCLRNNVLVSGKISSLHETQDAIRLSQRNNLILEKVVDDTFVDADDYHHIIRIISGTLYNKRVDRGREIYLSGGLMPSAAISHRIRGNRYHPQMRIASNPYFFTESKPYADALDVVRNQVEVSRFALASLTGILADYSFTELYTRGWVGDGACLGYAITEFCRLASSKPQAHYNLISILDYIASRTKPRGMKTA